MDFYEQGSFLCLDGPAKKAGLSHSTVKVCFVCRDLQFLQTLLKKLAALEDCYWVKTSREARDGMFLGRCFFTTPERAGEIWTRYKAHPRLMVNLQDDQFADQFRSRLFSWKGLPRDSLDSD